MKKEKLFRKENKKSLKTKYYVTTGGEYRWNRSKMKDINSDVMFQPMKSKKLGRDYTPLFQFLISKVGQIWADTHSEAISRLDDRDPIKWLVKTKDANPISRIDQHTFYHTLYVDEDGILQYVDKTATGPVLCSCCTHSIDGKLNKYKNG